MTDTATADTLRAWWGHRILLWVDNDEPLYLQLLDVAGTALDDDAAAEHLWDTALEPLLYRPHGTDQPGIVADMLPNFGGVRDALAERIAEVRAHGG